MELQEEVVLVGVEDLEVDLPTWEMFDQQFNNSSQYGALDHQIGDGQEGIRQIIQILGPNKFLIKVMGRAGIIKINGSMAAVRPEMQVVVVEGVEVHGKVMADRHTEAMEEEIEGRALSQRGDGICTR